MEKLSIKDVYFLVLNYYENKITNPMLNSQKGEMSFVLYDSFTFKLSVEERYGVFGAGLIIDSNQVLLEVLGEPLAINNDKDSIVNTLIKMENYCRLRLPNKFLEAYDRVYNKK
ncbi:hypothetical protein [Pseudogracilibacillus sp. SO30301A]|uniref:hypothetical protein n=1 Tax=Pseudogracilibacillus sp. SO30301A TaxID=3098291 RepID=UPI00300E2C0F